MKKSEYFDQKFLKAQKEKLMAMKNEILNNLSSKKTEDFFVAPDQVVEEGDQAQAYLDQNVNFGLRERELHKLRDVEFALERIENGTYGLCEETDEPIGKKRLEKMPCTTLSIEAAEREEKNYKVG